MSDNLHLRHEPMGPQFDKWHVEGMPRSAVLHRFTAPDNGPAHDHPFSFHSFVLSGGYVEEVFDRETGSSQLINRTPGESFYIEATHIHRIVHLPDGECWTIIIPYEWEQKSGFWEFREGGTYHRYWDEPDFKRID